MTAFARAVHHENGAGIICEIRSVNHRYRDIGVRLPDGWGALEMSLRARLAGRIARGKVDCHVDVRQAMCGGSLVVDADLADAVAQAGQALAGRHPHLAALSSGEILRWPGVVVPPAPDGYDAAIFAVVDEALDGLVVQRAREGAKLTVFLQDQLAEVEGLVARLRGETADMSGRLRRRLRERLAGFDAAVDPGRLEQELVLQVQRADVTEELDRLGVHADEARQVLAGGGPCGRKLDFLMQELHREATTLAAKSPSAAVTSMTVSLRVLIEQMREQVQNLE